MRWKSLLAVAAVAALLGLLPSQAGAQSTLLRSGLYVQGWPMSYYYPANSYYYPGISNEPFATNYYTRRWYNYPATTNYYSWGYSGSAYAPAMNQYAYVPADTTYINPGLRALYNQGYYGYSMPAYNAYAGYNTTTPSVYNARGSGIYVPSYGGVSIGAGGSSIYVPSYP
jgi:hypothetical protein